MSQLCWVPMGKQAPCPELTKLVAESMIYWMRHFGHHGLTPEFLDHAAVSIVWADKQQMQQSIWADYTELTRLKPKAHVFHKARRTRLVKSGSTDDTSKVHVQPDKYNISAGSVLMHVVDLRALMSYSSAGAHS